MAVAEGLTDVKAMLDTLCLSRAMISKMVMGASVVDWSFM